MAITLLMTRCATRPNLFSHRSSLTVSFRSTTIFSHSDGGPLSIVVDYSSMVKQRSFGPDNLEDGSDPSSAFLDALRTRAMDDLHQAALEYGIVLKDLAVIDRQFKGVLTS
jgi:hypothetical protein